MYVVEMWRCGSASNPTQEEVEEAATAFALIHATAAHLRFVAVADIRDGVDVELRAATPGRSRRTTGSFLHMTHIDAPSTMCYG